jgi:hypothetical protein
MANGPYNMRKYREPPGPVASLGDLMKSGTKWMLFYCTCGVHKPMALAPFAIRWGMDTPVPMLWKRLRCSTCGKLGCTTITPSYNVYTGTTQAFPT